MKQDRPEWTALALGELPPETAKQVEAELAGSPEGRAFVEETAAFARLLEEALQNEEAPPAVALPTAPPPAPPKVVPFTKRWGGALMKIAALLVLGWGGFFYYRSHLMPVEKPAENQPTPVAAATPAPDLLAEQGVAVASAPSGISLESITESTPDISGLVADEAFGLSASTDSAVMPLPLPPPNGSSHANLHSDDRIAPTGPSLGSSFSVAKLKAVKDFTAPWSPVPARRARAAAPSTPVHATEAYTEHVESGWQEVAAHPLSTFGVDVDTASYSNLRRMLRAGQLPPRGAVRVEEMINYFPYDDAPPTDTKHPLAAHIEVASSPWSPEHRLVRIALKGRESAPASRPQANLVFLIDVSGSMQSDDKLPLLKASLRLLVEQMREGDSIALVTYAGNAGLALPPTGGEKKAEILAALDRLEAGGSTNGGHGIQLAYDTAAQMMGSEKAIHRVILASDGDFNVGLTSESELVDLITTQAKRGIFLSVLGFGTGNLKDSTMEKLANRGNGHYAYIDSLREGRKVLVEQAGGTLETIAKDVKLQVEFNPATVKAYRLIGYENRRLKDEDFRDDTKDAGEIGAGHSVTALYEVVPAALPSPAPGGGAEPLKYQKQADSNHAAGSDELLTVKLRYKAPTGDQSQLVEWPVRDEGRKWEESSVDFRFTAAVAGMGQLLTRSPNVGLLNFSQLKELAQEGKGEDKGGYRAEFIELIEQARTVMERR
ncbi:MAG TPA: von Willebrand factor type A domain-containing protein [Chthoniobacteraceae bacterium]|nr:von Willebrand factor type A domain-containing protein [Chthoniobacteraceae bacterium]